RFAIFQAAHQRAFLHLLLFPPSIWEALWLKSSFLLGTLIGPFPRTFPIPHCGSCRQYQSSLVHFLLHSESSLWPCKNQFFPLLSEASCSQNQGVEVLLLSFL